MGAVAGPSTERTRWGGILIAGASLLGLGGFLLDFVLPRPPAGATAPVRAAALASAGAALRLVSYVHLVEALLLAAGGFFLVTRMLATRRDFPASSFWVFVGLAGVLFTGVDALNMGGMVHLARHYTATPWVFAAAEATGGVLMGVAVLALSLGALGVFWGEVGAERRAIARWLCALGLLGAALGVLGAAGWVGGVHALSRLLAGAFLVFVPMLVLGLKLARARA